MKKKQIDFVYSIDKFVFPALCILTYGFIYLESYFYIGVLRRYIYFDSRFLLVTTLLMSIFLIGRKMSLKINILFRINNFLLYTNLAIYFLMQLLEIKNFRNYIFSTYHIQPSNFFYAVIFSFSLTIIFNLIKCNYSLVKIKRSELLIWLVLAIIGLVRGAKVLDQAIYSNIYIASHINADYDFKMNERWGIYYDYIKFVGENTPENSSILVPPQELPWYSTGNVGLDRYFLFPRNLGNGSYKGQIDTDKYDYVLLVWGEWNGASPDRYSWPKINIQSDKVIYFNPESRKTFEMFGNYNPTMSRKNGVWGLIKLKK